ncbi:hypothetical protein RHSIM_Rhsim09G0097100 [Rhododendron simsii]|uniref:Uncharacterized protein n=1 Tax=Rhododendron simsii TaxID=118357 RepID=A0A834GE81_RHOSS|nr:hypothetical protein RHSIM_Rhsim09G0097100 [Rhododendron simsii]
MGLTSNELNNGRIMPLKRLRYGSHKSLTAENGCFSHGIFGNQLSKTLISRTQLYILSHLASPAAITAIGAPADQGPAPSFIAAKNSGPVAVGGVIGFEKRPNTPPNLRVRSLERERERARAREKMVVIVRVDPVSGE